MVYTLLSMAEVAGAVGLVVGIVIAARRRAALVPEGMTGRAGLVQRYGRWTALAVLVVYVASHAAALLLEPRFDIGPWSYQWWHHWTPVTGGIIGAVALIAELRRRGRVPEEPVLSLTRRTWLSFSRRLDVGAAAATLGAIIVTCVVAGLASNPGRSGWYTEIAIPTGDGDGAASFFGWGHALPVLVGILLLAALTAWILALDAARPFPNAAAVDPDTSVRRQLASTATGIFTATALLLLGDAWRQVGYAGMGTIGVGYPDGTEYFWSAGYSAIAPALPIAASVIQAFAVALLVVIIAGRLSWSPATTMSRSLP